MSKRKLKMLVNTYANKCAMLGELTYKYEIDKQALLEECSKLQKKHKELTDAKGK